MPTYDFRNKETGEISEVFLTSWKDKDKFLEDNPNLEQVLLKAPGLGDAMRMSVPGTAKADSTFEKYVIGRMKESIPGNTIKDGHKTKANREW